MEKVKIALAEAKFGARLVADEEHSLWEIYRND